jgi:shikimate dehydrogenase
MNFRIGTTGVFGFPVDENPGIVMYEAGYQAVGLNWRFQSFEVRPENLEAALAGMRAMQFEGLNLTIPHKIEAIKYMDELTPSARLIGAINTVIRREDRLIGENTDGKGFVIGMQKSGVSLEGKSLVVLGAGGASRAICVECALAGASSLTIINRTQSKGMELADMIGQNTECASDFIEWKSGVPIPPCDILINATNIGLYPDTNKPDIDYADIRQGMIVQDIIPNPAQTPFLREAKKRGARTFDGLQMLVYQGILAAKAWSGKELPSDVMIRALREVL